MKQPLIRISRLDHPFFFFYFMGGFPFSFSQGIVSSLNSVFTVEWILWAFQVYYILAGNRIKIPF